MTLDELMERYPHGSRWREAPGRLPIVRSLATAGAIGPYVVVGWDPGHPADVWFVDSRQNSARVDVCAMSGLERIPDPTPCPITEPVTLNWYKCGPTRWLTENPNWAEYPSGITLHPPRDGETFGRWTWEGGPE